MINIIEGFINNMTKDDIIKFAHKNGLNPSNHEIDFIYQFIKNNYAHVLKNPASFDLAVYKKEFSNENYLFLEKLVNKYKKMV